MAEERNVLNRIMKRMLYIIDAPVTFVREKIVEPNQQKYPWYHQQFRRVPTIDQCYADDLVCYTEANCQFARDKMVDNAILTILSQRFEDCVQYHGMEQRELCHDLEKIWRDNSENWFIKYGDLGPRANVKAAYMKQKHRMIWERRHGPVGSGMRTED